MILKAVFLFGPGSFILTRRYLSFVLYFYFSSALVRLSLTPMPRALLKARCAPHAPAVVARCTASLGRFTNEGHRPDNASSSFLPTGWRIKGRMYAIAESKIRFRENQSRGRLRCPLFSSIISVHSSFGRFASSADGRSPRRAVGGSACINVDEN